MPKINQEEYEVLKALDSRAKSIVRQARGWLWVAEQPIMKDDRSWFVADGFDEKLKDDNLFQFIQWEDGEPYNIAELIKEYKSSLIKSTPWTPNPLDFESEETEVKNIEWLKKEISTEMIQLEPNRKERWSDVKYQTLRSVAQKICQLDDPEVLSQEWIDEHATAVTYDDILDQTEIVYVDELENLIIPSQELPVIPQWVADSIESKKKVGTRLNVAMSEFPEYKLEKELGIGEHECNELYARAWLDGYTISSKEEELLYRVSAADMRSGFWFLCKDNDGDIMIGTNKDYYRAGWNSLKLTEQEIKDYDHRYMIFAEPVEELEE